MANLVIKSNNKSSRCSPIFCTAKQEQCNYNKYRSKFMSFLATFRKNLTTYASALTLGVSAVIASAPVYAEKTYTWKVQSHWPGSSSSYQDSLGRLKDVIERSEERRVGKECRSRRST